nr:sensor histidine kinase [Gorillibacterium massiliense]
MLLLYFASVFFPILVTNIVFYSVTMENVRDQRIKEITRAVDQIANQFKKQVVDTISVSTSFYTDQLLNETLETQYVNPADYVEAYDYVRRTLTSYSPLYNSVQAINLYVDNPTILTSGYVTPITEEVKDTDWYKAVNGSTQSLPLLFKTETVGKYDTFSIVRKLNYFSEAKKVPKFVKIDMNTDTIKATFDNLNLDGYIYLLNENNEIEYTTDPVINWTHGQILYDNVKKPKDTMEFATEFSGGNYLQGWRVIGTISEDEVLKALTGSRKFIFLLASLNLLIPTLVIVWITRSLNTRLTRVLRHMKKVKNQNFDTIDGGEARDEIGQLTSEFNRMTRRIDSLINDVYVADIQRKDLELQRRHAQLNALQSQINPHFLFNALETIRMRSLMKNETETARIIHNMAKIFRNSLAWSKDMVQVREEMEFIHCFLEIQKYRFGDKMDYAIEVDDEALDCRIPKMTFLPFVENASIHGIEPLKNGGRMEMRITREGGNLLFHMKDNGIGMGPDTVERILSYLKRDEEMGERVGIQNVIYRLKLYYGADFGFDLASENGKGTEITLTIPGERA